MSSTLNRQPNRSLATPVSTRLLHRTRPDSAGSVLSLTGAARELQLALATGYSTLLGLWLWARRWTESISDRDPLMGDFRSLFDELGAGFKVAALTLTAALLGGLLQRLAFEPLLSRMHLMAIVWDRSIAAQRELIEAKEKADRSGGGQTSVSATQGTLAGLRGGLVDLERGWADSRFRYHLAACLIFPALTAACLGGGWWVLALLAPLLLIGDGAVITSRALKKKEVLAEHVDQLERALWSDLVATSGGEARRVLVGHRSMFPIRSRVRRLDGTLFRQCALRRQAVRVLKNDLCWQDGAAPSGSEAVGGGYRFAVHEPRIQALGVACDGIASARRHFDNAVARQNFLGDGDLRAIEESLGAVLSKETARRAVVRHWYQDLRE